KNEVYNFYAALWSGRAELDPAERSRLLLIDDLHGERIYNSGSAQDELHLIGRFKSQRGVNRASVFAGMKPNGAEALVAAGVDNHFHQLLCQSAPAKLGISVNVEHIRSARIMGTQRMGDPVCDHQAGASGYAITGDSKPATVPALLQSPTDEVA